MFGYSFVTYFPRLTFSNNFVNHCSECLRKQWMAPEISWSVLMWFRVHKDFQKMHVMRIHMNIVCGVFSAFKSTLCHVFSAHEAHLPKTNVSMYSGGGEIAQSLVSLSTKRVVRVRARLDPLVTERWNSITVFLTRSHQCWWLVKKGRPCVIMSV